MQADIGRELQRICVRPNQLVAMPIFCFAQRNFCGCATSDANEAFLFWNCVGEAQCNLSIIQGSKNLLS